MKASSRTAFSLLEVIVCMALVGIMLVPLASMMKASAHAWQDAESEGGPEAQLRSAARWVHDTLGRADSVVDIDQDWIEFQRSGVLWRMAIANGQLRMRAGAQNILIADNVTAIAFQARRHPSSGDILAVDFQLTGQAVAAAAAPHISTLVTLDPLKLQTI